MNTDETIHPVETQWHYKIMTKYGFKPETKEQKGLVRGYVYKDNKGREVTCITGYSTVGS